MTDVHDAPDMGKGSDPPALRWDDAGACRRWLVDLRMQIQDALAAGKDATRRRAKRFFSRAEAARRVREGERAVLALLAAGERGLDGEAGP